MLVIKQENLKVFINYTERLVKVHFEVRSLDGKGAIFCASVKFGEILSYLDKGVTALDLDHIEVNILKIIEKMIIEKYHGDIKNSSIEFLDPVEYSEKTENTPLKESGESEERDPKPMDSGVYYAPDIPDEKPPKENVLDYVNETNDFFVELLLKDFDDFVESKRGIGLKLKILRNGNGPVIIRYSFSVSEEQEDKSRIDIVEYNYRYIRDIDNMFGTSTVRYRPIKVKDIPENAKIITFE